MEKHPHPIEDVHPHLYNPVTYQITPAGGNVVNSIGIWRGNTLPVYLMGSTILSVAHHNNVRSQKADKGQGSLDSYRS